MNDFDINSFKRKINGKDKRNIKGYTYEGHKIDDIKERKHFLNYSPLTLRNKNPKMIYDIPEYEYENIKREIRSIYP